jgi:hypothetical protein
MEFPNRKDTLYIKGALKEIRDEKLLKHKKTIWGYILELKVSLELKAPAMGLGIALGLSGGILIFIKGGLEIGSIRPLEAILMVLILIVILAMELVIPLFSGLNSSEKDFLYGLLALSKLFFDQQTTKQVFEPWEADFLYQYYQAIEQGCKWELKLIYLRNIKAFFIVFVFQLVLKLKQAFLPNTGV